jgi:hypothetical protein
MSDSVHQLDGGTAFSMVNYQRGCRCGCWCCEWTAADVGSLGRLGLGCLRDRIREAVRYGRGTMGARSVSTVSPEAPLFDFDLRSCVTTANGYPGTAHPKTSPRRSPRRCSALSAGTHTQAGMQWSLPCKPSMLCESHLYST